MIVIREKLFVESGDIIAGQINFFIRELIKIILLGDKCKNDIPHWIDNAIGAIDKARLKSKRSLERYSINILMFVALFKTTDKKINQFLRDDFNFLNLDQYLKDQFNEIYNQKDKGIYKYRSLINPKNIDWEDLLTKLKYIALCFSGQLDPDKDEFYESYKKVQRIHINFSSQCNKDTRSLLEDIIHNQFYL